MPCHSNNNHATNTCLIPFLLSLLLSLSSPRAAAQPSPQPGDPATEYSPPMATLLIILIGLFFAVGFLSLYLRHFAWCLGINYGGQRGGGNGVGGRPWLRQTTRGLDKSVIESFPSFHYSEVKVHRVGKGSLECAICLNEFISDDELLRLLPGCSHVFHCNCIDPWLQSHVTCPVCRANLEIQHERNHLDSLVRQLEQQISEEELEPSGGHDHRDVIVDIRPSPGVTKSPEAMVQEMKGGGARMGKLPRSHSTGHSLMEDRERFTLRLPVEVRDKLVTGNVSSLPAIVSPRLGYRARSVGCAGMVNKPDRWRFSVSPSFISRSNTVWSPKSEGATECSNVNTIHSAGFMSGPRSLLKLIKSPLNRGHRSSDIGERSSDQLWSNRSVQELDQLESR